MYSTSNVIMGGRRGYGQRFKADLNRWVLSVVLKEGNEEECLRCWGREWGTMEKAMSPQVQCLVWVKGVRRLLSADRSILVQKFSEAVRAFR